MHTECNYECNINIERLRASKWHQAQLFVSASDIMYRLTIADWGQKGASRRIVETAMTDSQLIREIKDGNTQLYAELIIHMNARFFRLFTTCSKVPVYSIWPKTCARRRFTKRSAV